MARRPLPRACVAIPAIALAARRFVLRMLAAILRQGLSDVVLLLRKMALLVTADVSLAAGFRLDSCRFAIVAVLLEKQTEVNGG
jgi:hypothetical protein